MVGCQDGPVCNLSRKREERRYTLVFSGQESSHGPFWANQKAGIGAECIDFTGTRLSSKPISPHNVCCFSLSNVQDLLR